MNAEGALALPAHERLLPIDSSDRVRDGDRGSHNTAAATRLKTNVDRVRALGAHLYGRREGRGLVGDGAVGHFCYAESWFLWRAVPLIDRKRLHHSHTSREALSQVFCFGEQFCGELV